MGTRTHQSTKPAAKMPEHSMITSGDESSQNDPTAVTKKDSERTIPPTSQNRENIDIDEAQAEILIYVTSNTLSRLKRVPQQVSNIYTLTRIVHEGVEALGVLLLHFAREAVDIAVLGHIEHDRHEPLPTVHLAE